METNTPEHQMDETMLPEFDAIIQRLILKYEQIPSNVIEQIVCMMNGNCNNN
jgi:hypothetical protein